MEKKLPFNKITKLSHPKIVNMADGWYEIASVDHFWIQWRFNAMLKYLGKKSLKNIKLFEIGCGHGLVIKQLEAVLPLTVDGCDLNFFALEQAEPLNGKLYVLDIYDEPNQLLQQYSGILLMDILEHIEEDSDFLHTSCKYLKNEGLVIINVPALQALYSKYDIKVGHLRRYNKKMLRNLLAANSIRILSIKYWGFSLLPLAILRKIVMLFTKDHSIVNKGFKVPGKFTNALLKLLMKAEIALLSSPPVGTSLIAIGKYTRPEKFNATLQTKEEN